MERARPPRERHVLAIDPGTKYVGFALIDVVGSSLSPGSVRARGIGTIIIPESEPLHRRFGLVLDKLTPIVREAKGLFAECVVERPFVNQNHMATLAIAGARAIALALIGRAGLRFAEYGPSEWRTVTGNGRSDKIRTAYVVKTILGIREDLPLDAAEAGGMALYHASKL